MPGRRGIFAARVHVTIFFTGQSFLRKGIEGSSAVACRAQNQAGGCCTVSGAVVAVVAVVATGSRLSDAAATVPCSGLHSRCQCMHK